MFWLELYGIGADGNPAEMRVGNSCPSVEAAKGEACRLFTEAAQWSLVKVSGARVRNASAAIVFQERF